MLKKFSTLFYGFSVLVISWASIHYPSYYWNYLVSTSWPFALTRALIAISLVAYAIFPQLRNSFTKHFITGIGFGLLALSFMTMVSPDLMGYFDYYVPLGEVLCYVEGGILAIVLATEFPIYNMQFENKLNETKDKKAWRAF